MVVKVGLLLTDERLFVFFISGWLLQLLLVIININIYLFSCRTNLPCSCFALQILLEVEVLPPVVVKYSQSLTSLGKDPRTQVCVCRHKDMDMQKQLWSAATALSTESQMLVSYIVSLTIF